MLIAAKPIGSVNMVVGDRSLWGIRKVYVC